MKKRVLSAVAAMCMLCLCGCAFANEKRAYSEAAEVPTEVVGVNFVCVNGMTVGGRYVDFKAEERKLVSCSALEFQDHYYEWSRYTADGLIFAHQYAVRGDHVRENGKLVENAHRVDVGIFKADARAGEVVLLKDIKDIVPFDLFEVAHLPVVRGMDERYIVMSYNGLLEVVDAEDGQTVYSAVVYPDPERYARTQNGANARFVGLDLAFIDGGLLDYYVYGGGEYARLSFSSPAISSSAQAERYGDTVFVTESGSVTFAADLKTGEPLPEEELYTRYELAASGGSEDEPSAPPEYTIGGRTYAIAEAYEREDGYNSSTYDKCTLSLTEAATGEVTTIDEALLSTCPAFVRIKGIYEKYFPEGECEFALRSWNTDRERLFLNVYRPLYKAYTNPKYSPAFVFEFLPKTCEIKYCGMSGDTFIRAFAANEV